MSDYVARLPIQAPGTLVLAYNEGDPVIAQVVQDWGLTEDQVAPADGYQVPRPAEDSDDRGAWEAYVVGQGTSREDARAASLPELKAMYEAPAEAEPPAWQVNDAEAANAELNPDGGAVERPADSANKADWIAYVVDQGADSDWANASTTTKDDLKSWS